MAQGSAFPRRVLRRAATLGEVPGAPALRGPAGVDHGHRPSRSGRVIPRPAALRGPAGVGPGAPASPTPRARAGGPRGWTRPPFTARAGTAD
jgi:hypothetical protein